MKLPGCAVKLGFVMGLCVSMAWPQRQASSLGAPVPQPTPSSSPFLASGRYQPPGGSFDAPSRLLQERGLSGKEKFQLFLKSSYSPSRFVSAGLTAGYEQARNFDRAYGQGATGYGGRYGAALADAEAGAFFKKFLMPCLLRQDPRYFPAPGNYGFRHRVGYAMSRVLFTRSDAGRTTVNSSRILGSLASEAAANTYRVYGNRDFPATLQRTGASLASDAGMNILHEFWPDIRRKVFHRKH